MSWNRRSFFQWMAVMFGSGGSGAAQAPHSSGRSHPAPAVTPRAGGYIRPGSFDIIHKIFDLVVVGGGISGTCAAISAARNGVKTALVHERSMLGGNSSSEVRLFPEDTAHHSTWVKESGILDEIHTEERVRNWEPYIEGLMNCHWDLVLYEWAVREKNLTLYLNTTIREVEMKDASHILAVHGIQLGTERTFVLEAPLFVDASGDGVLGYRAGAALHWGKEARSEYGEPLAPEQPDAGTMGNTLFFRARDAGRPIHFKKPDWAVEIDSEQQLTARGHTFLEGGYWWIEVGYPMHPIKDNEEIRHEALRQLLGLWDHIKNRCEHRGQAANYALEFVGFWPYKRESRRILGDFVLRQHDTQDPEIHADDIAYGCWGVDIHVPGGILKQSVAPYPPPGTDANWERYGTYPYGIPLRACYSRNIRNLLTAGRPISASYVAFASSRVLPTGAVVGQGVGVAAALCRRYRCEPSTVAHLHAEELQQILLRQDAYIPGAENRDSDDLARQAQASHSSESLLIFPEEGTPVALRYPSAQLFPVSADHLEAVELLLTSSLPRPARMRLGLRPAAHVWDFRASRDLASATATVPAGHHGYVRFPLNVRTEPGRLYYVHLQAQPGISWTLFSETEGAPSRVPAGTSAANLPGASRWRPLSGGKSFALRIVPEQRPYTAHNINHGASRPDRWPNLFVSDPAQGLPAWVELRWPWLVRFNTVQLTFDTDVNRRCRLPLFRYPDCVKRYEMAVGSGSGWKTIVQEEENYSRRRVHRFAAVEADQLRVTVHETNGAKSARIYEARVYNDTERS